MNNPLTLIETIENHRKLWNWIADETERQERIVEKEEYFAKKYFAKNKQYEYILNSCFCCHYTKDPDDNLEFVHCQKCPLDWNVGGIDFACECHDALYSIWQELTDNEWKEAAEYAREIANLPLKPEYQKMYDEEISKLMEKNQDENNTI